MNTTVHPTVEAILQSIIIMNTSVHPTVESILKSLIVNINVRPSIETILKPIMMNTTFNNIYYTPTRRSSDLVSKIIRIS
jgi:hypothetical protein